MNSRTTMRDARCQIPSASTVWLLMVLILAATGTASAQSLQFFGTGQNDVDRVKVPIDGAQPADIGATDFTIEVWLRTTPGNNAPAVAEGPGYNWIWGNTFFDRDLYSRNPGFGASLTDGRVTFGLKNSEGLERTWRGTSDLRDGNWHHVAITRSVGTGVVQIYVDGVREEPAVGSPVAGPTGDLSYPGGTPNPAGTQGDRFMVLAAEKHDYGPTAPSFFGFMTELRLSRTIRYTTQSFPVETSPFTTDADTVALYHFDERSGGVLGDSSLAAGGPSNGTVRFNGSNTRPAWSSASPFQSAGSVQWTSSTATANEAAGTVSLQVSRTGGDAGAIAVSFATSPGTATAPADFAATSGVLNWIDGDVGLKTVAVPITNDSQSEVAEQFSVVLSSPTNGASLGSPANIAVTVADDDPVPGPGTIAFSAGSVLLNEGGSPVTVSVVRSGGDAGAVSVSYAPVNNTASAADYSVAGSVLNWADGTSGSRTFTISAVNDSASEGSETFSIGLGLPTAGATLGSPSTLAVTIVDDDPPPAAGSLQFRAGTASVNEGASVAVAVTRVGGSAGAVSVTYTVSNGTASANDYSLAGTLDWPNNDPADRTITIAAVDDTAFEGSESFTVSLGTPTGGATLGTPASLAVNIVDNDPPPPAGILQFGSATYGATEGQGTLVLQVTRASGAAGEVTVGYSTVPGSAAAPADFVQSSGTLTWAAGDPDPKPITIAIANDSAAEGAEQFTVTLQNPTGGASLGTPSTALVSLADDDPPPPAGTLRFSTGTLSVTEGQAPVSLAVLRSGGVAGAVTVAYATVAGSAAAGSDFTPASGELRWEAGDDNPKSFTVVIADDNAIEPVEQFSVVLSAQSNGVTLSSPSVATISIADNDTGTGGGSASPAASGGGGTSEPVWLLALGGLLCWRRRLCQSAGLTARGIE